MRRMMVTLCIAAAVLSAGCSTSSLVHKLPLIGSAKAQDPANVFGSVVAERLQAGSGLIVIGPVSGTGREAAYMTQANGSWTVRGQKITLDGTAHLTMDGPLLIAETQKDGAPQYAAYRFSANGLAPVDYYAEKAPEPTVKTGQFVLVIKGLNVLYHYQDGKLVKAYRVATGRQTQPPAPDWQTYKTNFFTPEGSYRISNFVPNPPFNALKTGDESFAGGAPGNPLGTRWMGFGVIDGDNAWIWGIHGTSHPEQIGTWASDGCIRMYTNEAEELFGQIKGTNPALQVVGKL